MVASSDWGKYDRLIAEALTAFEQDVGYAIQIVESARSITSKKRAVTRKPKSKT